MVFIPLTLMKLKVLSLIFFSFLTCFSQVNEQIDDLIIIGEDSIPKPYIDLNEVVLFQPLTFNDYDSAKRYAVLRNRTHKVYSYAKMAADRLKILNDRLKLIVKIVLYINKLKKRVIEILNNLALLLNKSLIENKNINFISV